MEIVKNSLKELMGRWDDPGDYMNNLAGTPLPSRMFVEDVEGCVKVKCSFAEIQEALDSDCDLQSLLDLVVELENCKVDSWTVRNIIPQTDGLVVVFDPYHWSDYA